MASLGEKPSTYVGADDKTYEMGTVVEATVAEKHRGTITDQHDMKVLGRTQELRVGDLPSP